MKRIINLVIFTMILTLITSPLTNVASANEAKETVVVEQVGTSGGIPAIKAQIKNSAGIGTYTLVLTNPNNGSAHSQLLNNSGKPTTYVPNNFDNNGTYKYTLFANGIEVADGGVNLVSSKRTPTFVVVTNGTDITIDVKKADDYIGQMVSFTSGGYSGRLEVSSSSMQRAFENATGLGPKMTFTGPVGDLVTVDVQRGDIKPTNPNTPTAPPTNTNDNGTTGTTKPPATNNKPNGNNNSNNNAGSNSGSSNSNTNTNQNNINNNPGVSGTPNSSNSTNTGNQNNGNNSNGSSNSTNTNTDKNNTDTTDTPQASASQNINARGEIWAISNADNITKNIKLTLNKANYKTDQTIVAKVEFFHKDYAGKAVTIRLDADRESTTSLVTLDPNGKGTATFKIPVPQPSSKVIGATAYSISGSLLDKIELNYTIENEVKGTGANMDDDTARISYMALDLTSLETRKAVLAWYGAKNINKYDTRLRVINNTTHNEHIYSVYIPDGESKINMNLVYDGPGIYTWELYVDGKILIQSPYSTPVEVDGTPTSQNGLPVLKTLANKNIQNANLESTDPNGVSGATIGEPIGGSMVADDFTQIDYDQQLAEQESGGKGKMLILIILILVVLVGGVAAFFMIKRKQAEQDKDAGFVAYDGDDENDRANGDDEDDEFKEA